MVHLCRFRNHELTSSDKEMHHELRRAVQSKDIPLVQHLIQNKGVLVNKIPELGSYGSVEYQMPLHLAVISRCVEVVKILLDSGADTHNTNFKQETPLIMSAKMQNTTITDLLLSHESQDSEDDHGFSHLHVACMRGNVDVVRKILLDKEGRNLNSAVKKSSVHWPGFTPLHFAVHFEQVETVKFLLDRGANIVIKDTRQLTPLHLADLQRNEEVIDLLLTAHKYCFNNPTDAQGLSHFHIACTRNNTSAVEHFLKSGVNVNLEDKSWWKPIHFAIYYECNDVIDLLSKTKIHLRSLHMPSLLKSTYLLQNQMILSLAPARIRNSDDVPGISQQLLELSNACISNNEDKVEQLLSDGGIDDDFDLNLCVTNGCTPLHLAVRSRSQTTAVILLNHGANFMLQDPDGKTALHIAFDLKLTRVLDKILTKVNNETPNLIDNEGLSVFHILCTTNKRGTVENFLRQGVNINLQVGRESVCWAGFTPVHFAIEYEQPNIVDLLLRSGADISVTNESGLDSFEYAFDCLDCLIYDESITYEIINLILSARTGVENFDDRGVSPLHILCITCDDDLEVLQPYMLSHQEYIDKPIKFSKRHLEKEGTPLHLAMIYGNFRQALLLIDNGADLFRLNNDGDDPLYLGFSNGMMYKTSTIEAEKIFLIAIASMEKFKPSHFYMACASGFSNVVKKVLENLTDEKLKIEYVNYPNDAGQTPLHNMLQRIIEETNKEQIVRLLLENGAEVNAQDHMLQTPLHYVRKGRDLGITRILLEHGADVNAQNIYGQTPLHKMLTEVFESNIFFSDPDISDNISFRNQVILLLESGFDIDILDEEHRSYLGVVNSLLRENREEEIGVSNEIKLDITCILLKHVRKLQMTRLHPLHENNEVAYLRLMNENIFYNESDFDRTCQDEIDQMLSVQIDSRMTLYHILFKSLDDMAFHCENVNLLTVVESNDFVKFPVFGFLIKLQIKNGRARRLLLKNAEEPLRFLMRKSLPRECLEKILRILTNADLQNVISSRNLPIIPS